MRLVDRFNHMMHATLGNLSSLGRASRRFDKNCWTHLPILNGTRCSDSEGHVIYLGPQRTKIHRYLLIIFLAKSAQMFRLSGKEIDNSIYFTLYALKEIAKDRKS